MREVWAAVRRSLYVRGASLPSDITPPQEVQPWRSARGKRRRRDARSWCASCVAVANATSSVTSSALPPSVPSAARTAAASSAASAVYLRRDAPEAQRKRLARRRRRRRCSGRAAAEPEGGGAGGGRRVDRRRYRGDKLFLREGGAHASASQQLPPNAMPSAAAACSVSLPPVRAAAARRPRGSPPRARCGRSGRFRPAVIAADAGRRLRRGRSAIASSFWTSERSKRWIASRRLLEHHRRAQERLLVDCDERHDELIEGAAHRRLVEGLPATTASRRLLCTFHSLMASSSASRQTNKSIASLNRVRWMVDADAPPLEQHDVHLAALHRPQLGIFPLVQPFVAAWIAASDSAVERLRAHSTESASELSIGARPTRRYPRHAPLLLSHV